jgi:long-chain acyl-CoA synthetase
MQGYYGMAAETEAALADGWFHTGDVGQLDDQGYLRITDRLKDLIVTAGGKNVAPQPIESHLKASKFIAEAVLVGDGRKFVTTLVVPRFPTLQTHAKATGLGEPPIADLVRAPAILQLFEILLGKLNAQLPPYERIKRFCLLDRDLRIEDGEITPTLKVKRNVIAKAYAAQIDAMYQDPVPAGVGCPPTDAADPRFDAVSSP